MIPKRPQKHEENTDAWLMSYADMITLLLCFFIIFVSVSEPKKDKLSDIAEGMAGKFGAVEYESPFQGAMRSLQTSVEVHKLYKDVAVTSTSRSLAVEISTQRFFKNGAEIDDETMPILRELVGGLKQSNLENYTIAIESHTDDTPPQSGLYKSNWELSSVRAGKVAEYFIQQGFNPSQIKAVGFADSRPDVPNLDATGQPIPANRAKNNRVVIRLEETQK